MKFCLGSQDIPQKYFPLETIESDPTYWWENFPLLLSCKCSCQNIKNSLAIGYKCIGKWKKNVKQVLYSTLLKKLEALKTKASIIIFAKIISSNLNNAWLCLFVTELTILGVNHFYPWWMVLPLSKHLSV